MSKRRKHVAIRSVKGRPSFLQDTTLHEFCCVHNSTQQNSTCHNWTQHHSTCQNSTRPPLDTAQLGTSKLDTLQLYTDHMAVRLKLLQRSKRYEQSVNVITIRHKKVGIRTIPLFVPFATKVLLQPYSCDARLPRSGGIPYIFKACEKKSLCGICPSVWHHSLTAICSV